MTNYKLYTAPTPNGWKASCTLEELGLDYEAIAVNLGEGEQKKPEFLAMNPNGRIPVLVDASANDFAIFESGAIMLYLAEKHGDGSLLPTDALRRSEVVQWLMFQMGGIGPMMGQANVFHRYFPERIEAAVQRYQNESRRLFEVINTQLSDGRDFLCKDFSLADIANWSWVRIYEWSGVSVDGLEPLQQWLARMEQRPACKRGVDIIKREPVAESEDAADKLVKSGQSMLQR